MRWLLAMALIFVATSVHAEQEAPTLAQAPEQAVVEQARDALAAGALDKVLSLLANARLQGEAACIYGQALELHTTTKRAGEEARLLLYLERCQADTPSTERRNQVRSLQEKLRKAKFGPVSLTIRPETALATIEGSFSSDTLLADDELWLAFGTYRLEVVAEGHEGGTYAIHVSSPDRMLVAIRLPESKAQETTTIDLGEDAGADLGQVARAADPRPKKFKTLLAKRYQGPNDSRTNPTEKTQERGTALWPALSAISAASAIGLGVGFQIEDRQRSAVASYAVGSALTGLTLYLLLRERAPHAAGTRIEVDAELALLSYAMRF